MFITRRCRLVWKPITEAKKHRRAFPAETPGEDQGEGREGEWGFEGGREEEYSVGLGKDH